jgi:hypothetical protein
MNMLLQNPEFRRNLWLELSPQRLVLMPGLIALVLFVLSLARHHFWTLQDMAGSILFLALAGFVGLTIVWGGTQAGNTLSHEFKNGTWDSQRMSSLTPWQMVWGKLLGGTLYAWYGGVILLTLAAAVASLMNIAWGRILLAGAGLISLAILTQAMYLLRVLMVEQKTPGTNHNPAVFRTLLVIFLLIGSGSFSKISVALWKETAQIAWYGSSWHLLQFSVFTLMALTVWVLIGVWQAMRRELLLKNRPWWWLAFLLFWIVWGAGFVQQIFPLRDAPESLNFILMHANIYQNLDPFCFLPSAPCWSGSVSIRWYSPNARIKPCGYVSSRPGNAVIPSRCNIYCPTGASASPWRSSWASSPCFWPRPIIITLPELRQRYWG